jgi:hypothetical protein
MGDKPDDTQTTPTPEDVRKRKEERDLVTGGEPLVDDDVLEQPTDDVPADKGSGKDDPTPNPAKIAP